MQTSKGGSDHISNLELKTAREAADLDHDLITMILQIMTSGHLACMVKSDDQWFSLHVIVHSWFST